MSDGGGGPGGPANLIDHYLDGLMDVGEREAFEARLAQDPLLRAEVDRQGEIDGALTRLFVPPAAPALPLPVARPSAKPEGLALQPRRAAKAPGVRWGRLHQSPWAAVAALIAIALCSWQVYRT